MTNCPACGAPIGASDVSCQACGRSLEGSTESFTPVSVAEEQQGADTNDGDSPVFVVRKGHEAGERFYIDRDVLTIGRDPSADIFLCDITVSRKHAVVERSESGVTIKDSGSLNGTYVNGACVDTADLSNGDVVQVGMFQMVFLAGPEGM